MSVVPLPHEKRANQYAGDFWETALAADVPPPTVADDKTKPLRSSLEILQSTRAVFSFDPTVRSPREWREWFEYQLEVQDASERKVIWFSSAWLGKAGAVLKTLENYSPVDIWAFTVLVQFVAICGEARTFIQTQTDRELVQVAVYDALMRKGHPRSLYDVMESVVKDVSMMPRMYSNAADEWRRGGWDIKLGEAAAEVMWRCFAWTVDAVEPKGLSMIWWQWEELPEPGREKAKPEEPPRVTTKRERKTTAYFTPVHNATARRAARSTGKNIPY